MVVLEGSTGSSEVATLEASQKRHSGWRHQRPAARSCFTRAKKLAKGDRKQRFAPQLANKASLARSQNAIRIACDIKAIV